jgi:pimeloyl-ACP methyl ester carboxylesterase
MSAIADHHRSGAGEPLLLLHGFSTTWRSFGPLPGLLAEHFDVFAPTLAGHTGGPSLEAPVSIEALVGAVEAMLDEVSWSDPHIAGFSLGGRLAFELAKRGRARTVTAISPAGGRLEPNRRDARHAQRLFRRGRALGRQVAPRIDALARSPTFRRFAMRDMQVHGERMTPAEMAGLLRDHIATPIFDEFLDRVVPRGGIEQLERVTCPVHIVWGVHDRVLPVEQAALFQDRIAHATLRLIADAGHVPFWDAPDALVREIRAEAAAPSSALAAAT